MGSDERKAGGSGKDGSVKDTVVVVGGTGQAGRAVVVEALHRGLDVRVVSRGVPAAGDPRRVAGASYVAVDLLADDAAARLGDVLVDARAVIDASRGTGPRSGRVLTEGSRHVAEAAGNAGVRRAAVLSIVNADRGAYDHYQAKAEQERMYLGRNERPAVTVVRTTQFHSFLGRFYGPDGQLGRWTHLGLLPYPRKTAFQPIDLTDVARALVEAALEDGPSRTWSVAGPQTLDAGEMTRQWRRAHGSHRPVVGVPLPGALGAFFRDGLNLLPGDHYGRVTYAEWLERSTGEHSA